MKKNVQALVIDGQRGFLDENLGELYVPGSEKDAVRAATLITENKRRLSDLHFTLDSHHLYHIANPLMWVDGRGNHPEPFTDITDAVIDGHWHINSPNMKDRERGVKYCEELIIQGRYRLTIWNPHCIIGTRGHQIFGPLVDAMLDWESHWPAIANKWVKGSNPWTEHYSAVRACIEDPDDIEHTGYNMDLIDAIAKADRILVIGWALNFCLASTLLDISDKFDFGDPDFTNTKKMILLTDCTSPIPDQPGQTIMQEMTDAFMKTMATRGMQTAKSTDTNLFI